MAMEICGIAATEKFAKLFSELERSDEIVQKQKIEEMNELLDVMKKDEFRSVFTIELFDKMDKMIEEEKLSTRNASVLLKQLGYYKTLKGIRGEEFYLSSLHYRISMMIINGNKKKEGKDINLLVDLCECYLLLSYNLDSEEVSICVPCLLKVALNKKKIIEIQKIVEMSLLSLSLIYQLDEVEHKKFLCEIKTIVKYHQRHHNLTQLAYQSVWGCILNRFENDKSLESLIVNELHFAREATRELEELSKCVDWERKEEEERRGKEKIEEYTFAEWCRCICLYFRNCQLRTEESIKLISSITQIFRAATANRKYVGLDCIYILSVAAENEAMKTEDLLKGGTVDAVLEEFQRHTFFDKIAIKCLKFLMDISSKLKKEEKDEKEEKKRKLSIMKLFEKMEEEGLEDFFISSHGIFVNQNKGYYYEPLLNTFDYLANI